MSEFTEGEGRNEEGRNDANKDMKLVSSFARKQAGKQVSKLKEVKEQQANKRQNARPQWSRVLCSH